eukprot:UN03962
MYYGATVLENAKQFVDYNIISDVTVEVITDKTIYSIRDSDNTYLSYAFNGFCYGGYDGAQNSKFEFIRSGNGWFIRNKYNDRRVNRWLGISSKLYVGLYSKIRKRAKWKLIPSARHTMLFRIECEVNNTVRWIKVDKNDRHQPVFCSTENNHLFALQIV